MTEVSSLSSRFEKDIQSSLLYCIQNKKVSVMFFGGFYAEEKESRSYN